MREWKVMIKSALTDLIAKLNRNRVFKFISSVRLAVPVMIAIGATVAAGTIFESNYTAEYARAAVYGTIWFKAILGLLALNIFASMMSRFPWRKHHTGFVITHIGILVVLGGGAITDAFGIDGSLQLPLNESNNRIILPGLMVAYQYADSPTLNSVAFSRGLFEKSGADLDFLNQELGHVFKVERYLPFAEVSQGYSPGDNSSQGPVAISFGLKSQFFSVQQWLHSIDTPVLQLGPATLKLIVDDSQAGLPNEPKAPRLPASQAMIVIFDQKSNSELARVPLAKLKKAVIVNGVEIRLQATYQRAIVAGNKIEESEDPSAKENRAVALILKRDQVEKREILFAKFPDFSMGKGDLFGLGLRYLDDGSEAPPLANSDQLPPGHPVVSQDSSDSATVGNTIEFHIDRRKPDVVRIELWKAGKKIAEQSIKEGDTYQTPWMGMQIYVASINIGSTSVSEARAVKPKAGQANLPTSAIFVRPQGQEVGFWLSLGDSKRIDQRGRPVEIIFSNQLFSLPFSIELEKFTKRDYPGTETPYSYESVIRYSEDGSEHLISMNEPYEAQGFTLYQASFVMNPGQPPISILSVNRDPGRPVKYLGSLILAIGIITFTLMRSRLYQRKPT